MLWTAKRMFTDSKFSRVEAHHAGAEGAVARPDPVDAAALPGPTDLIDPVDLIADQPVARAAVRLRVLAHRQGAHRQGSAVLRVQDKAGVTSGSSCLRFASANPGRFRSSPCAS
jgi:hypothetical protein